MEPLKINGPWKQGIYEQSETATETVGTLRVGRNGKKYRYARAGATALDVGMQTVSPIPNADWINKAPAAAAAIGAKYVTLTITDAGTDVLPADYFKGGNLLVKDGIGEKYQYEIKS